MKRLFLTIGAVLLVSSLALAGPKTYQVTGPILDIKDDTITIMKGKEKWEIGKDAATKITGVLKVGAKVTIEYIMNAKSIEVKETVGQKAKEAGKKAEEAGKKAEEAGKKAEEAGKDAASEAGQKTQ